MAVSIMAVNVVVIHVGLWLSVLLPLTLGFESSTLSSLRSKARCQHNQNADGAPGDDRSMHAHADVLSRVYQFPVVPAEWLLPPKKDKSLISTTQELQSITSFIAPLLYGGLGLLMWHIILYNYCLRCMQ